MRRIAIVGNSGSGKTSLARDLAAVLGIAHIELDALFHQENWEPRPAEEFRQALQAAMREADRTYDGWTTCGNYETASNRMNQLAADTIVWLDMPRSLVMSRVVHRTVKRAISREVLWNGNREPMSNFYSWDPERNIMRWAWVKHEEYRSHFESVLEDGSLAHADVHRLRSPAEVEQFLESART